MVYGIRSTWLAQRCRGSAYILVLGVSLIVTALAVAGILATRVQARSSAANSDMAGARLCAQAGIELARLWIAQDPNWRTNRPTGSWATNLAVADGAVTIAAADPTDGALGKRPHDPVQLTAIGTKGQARHVLRVTLVADPVPLPVLKYAMATGGEYRLRSPYALRLGSGSLSVNTRFRNESIVEGNVDCQTIDSAGTVLGKLTGNVPPKAMPGASVAESYAALGTQINTTLISRQVLTPTLNPWGAANGEGVYVIRSSNDVTISQSRIHGTLVVICPGRTVTIDGAVMMHPARADYPALIVNGDVAFDFTGTGMTLSEAANGTNFNPTGASFNNASDGDTLDEYPSEIRGLVHVTGNVSIRRSGLIRGALIAEADGGTGTIEMSSTDFQIVYDPSLWTSPPPFFTSLVPMPVLAGSYMQAVE